MSPTEFLGKYIIYNDLIKECQSNEDYMKCIFAFLNDPLFDPRDDDDVCFFEQLVLLSKFGKRHIYIYDYILLQCEMIEETDQLLLNLSKYMVYLSQFSKAFWIDAIQNILWFYYKKSEKYSVLNKIFISLDSSSREEMLSIILKEYPELISKCSKIELYILYS